MSTGEKPMTLSEAVLERRKSFYEGMTCGEFDYILKLERKIERLQAEVEVLRRYGNKDCTAMADEQLEKNKP